MSAYDTMAIDRLMDLMLTARLAEELAKPEHLRGPVGCEYLPSDQFAWAWGRRSIATADRHWVRVTWHGRDFEEMAETKDRAARRLLLLHLDPDEDEEMAA